MTLNEARTQIAAHNSLNLNVMEAARRGSEVSEAYDVVSSHAASRQDAARVAVALRRARDNERTVTFIVSLKSDPRRTMAYDVQNGSLVARDL